MPRTARVRRRIGAALGGAALAAWSALTPAGADSPARPDSVVVKKEAYVKGPSVLLGEVAALEGDRAAALAGIEITGAAPPGESKRIDAALLTARIQSAGLGGHALEVTGADSVIAKTLARELTDDMLTADLRAFIESQMPWDPDETMIDVTAQTSGMVLPDGPVTIKWWPNPQYRWVGPGVFRGEVLVDGAMKRTVLVRAVVEVYTDVLVSTTDIPRGSVLAASHVQLEKRALSAIKGDVIRSLDEAVGLVARSTLFPGQVISSRQLTPRQILKRNQVVTVETRAGGLVVRGRARVQMNANEGDLVTCLNPDSKEAFQGVVRKDGVVVVE